MHAAVTASRRPPRLDARVRAERLVLRQHLEGRMDVVQRQVEEQRLPRRLVALVVLLNRVASECVCRLVPLVESDLIDEHRYLHQITAMGSGGGSGGHQEVAEVVAKGDRDNGDNSNGSESSNIAAGASVSSSSSPFLLRLLFQGAPSSLSTSSSS